MNAASEYFSEPTREAAPMDSEYVRLVSSADSQSIEAQADLWLAALAKLDHNEIRLGLPSRSAEQRGNEGGISPGAARPPTPISDEDALTDIAWARMKLRHRSVHVKVIDIKYFRGDPASAIMTRFRVQKSEAYRMIRRAQAAFWRLRMSLVK